MANDAREWLMANHVTLNGYEWFILVCSEFFFPILCLCPNETRRYRQTGL